MPKAKVGAEEPEVQTEVTPEPVTPEVLPVAQRGKARLFKQAIQMGLLATETSTVEDLQQMVARQEANPTPVAELIEQTVRAGESQERKDLREVFRRYIKQSPIHAETEKLNLVKQLNELD